MGAVFSKMEAPLLTTPYLATILRLKQMKRETKKLFREYVIVLEKTAKIEIFI